MSVFCVQNAPKLIYVHLYFSKSFRGPWTPLTKGKGGEQTKGEKDEETEMKKKPGAGRLGIERGILLDPVHFSEVGPALHITL